MFVDPICLNIPPPLLSGKTTSNMVPSPLVNFIVSPTIEAVISKELVLKKPPEPVSIVILNCEVSPLVKVITLSAAEAVNKSEPVWIEAPLVLPKDDTDN